MVQSGKGNIDRIEKWISTGLKINRITVLYRIVDCLEFDRIVVIDRIEPQIGLLTSTGLRIITSVIAVYKRGIRSKKLTGWYSIRSKFVFSVVVSFLL